MFILDAHLDLSMNAIDWNRDLRWTVDEIREFEKGMTDLPGRSQNTVSLDAMRKGNIGLCVATQIARYVKKDNPLPGWNSPEQAWAHTQAQLAWYQEMMRQGEMQQISNSNELENHLKYWNSNDDNRKKAIGFILSLEGADSIVTLDHLHKAYEYGLRAVGPAHYGSGTYAFGTDSIGGIGEKGKALLREMERLNIILDATHLCDQSFWEAMDVFNGAVWASHNNCRELINHNRQFSDEQLKELINRKAVIGVVMDTWMMVPNWVRGKTTPQSADACLRQIIDNIDHICQLAGNTNHVGIGSDLDGGFGKEQTPHDIDTIADLQKIHQMLYNRGYSKKDIEGIMHGNFLRFIRDVWS
ncbi:dipeptidase [Galbibacter pacificus]|uniref:Membrane dipeptidase n=1 Tax=Galbibacter pacificus TaxID=2996052 RepID=A0ABT6FSN5_9FLAO|nr:membrane dipeptidase [Galbibacter pacificus]MDG3582606.1 membrane dipeptidase [Galbibacter pacificus]MDG3586275.1 membrane dipeptidase [Galbibacter pacificus]